MLKYFLILNFLSQHVHVSWRSISIVHCIFFSLELLHVMKNG